MIDIEAKALELAPLIRARIPDMEQQRRLPTDLAQTFAQAGLYRMTIPRDLGGLECSPQTLFRTIATVAQADASAGWCVMIGVTSAIYSAYLPIEIARPIYDDPELITGGVFASMGKARRQGDHYRVDGHWRWASGSHNCKWLNGGCVLIEEDGSARTLPNGAPESRSVMVPIRDVELVDTWHTMGLVGTGSVDMKMSNVRVPVARSVSLAFDSHAHKALYTCFRHSVCLPQEYRPWRWAMPALHWTSSASLPVAPKRRARAACWRRGQPYSRNMRKRKQRCGPPARCCSTRLGLPGTARSATAKSHCRSAPVCVWPRLI